MTRGHTDWHQNCVHSTRVHHRLCVSHPGRRALGSWPWENKTGSLEAPVGSWLSTGSSTRTGLAAGCFGWSREIYWLYDLDWNERKEGIWTSASFRAFEPVHRNTFKELRLRYLSLPPSDNRTKLQPHTSPPPFKAVLSHRFGPASFNRPWRKEL